MTTTQQTISQGDHMKDIVFQKNAQGVTTIQDVARSGVGDTSLDRNRSNGHHPETIPQPSPPDHPFFYPVWPTSKPGPLATTPPPGQYPHRMRTDQMVYECYDQEHGIPCVASPKPSRQPEKRARSYLPAPRLLGVETAEMARWLDDGGRESQENEPIMHT